MQLHLLLRNAAEELSEHGCRVTPEVLAGEEEPPFVRDDLQPLLLRARGEYELVCEEIAAIQALGGEVRGLDEGLVDFCSWLDGHTEVLLCWKLGEPRIEHYHPLAGGFAGRRLIFGHEFLASPAGLTTHPR